MPEAVECLNCHQTIQKDRPSIQKLVAIQKKNKPVPWARVYKLPDFVFFSHQKHADAKVECETCHGSVRTRDILWQEKDISMNACVDCHKARRHPSIVIFATRVWSDDLASSPRCELMLSLF